MQLTRWDILVGLMVPLTWGLGIVFAKAALGDLPPILLIAGRFTVAALVLVWFVPVPRGRMREIAAIAFVSAAVHYSLTFSGLAGLDASVTALLVQLEVPFLVLVGMIWMKETPSLRKWAGIAAAFVGILLIVGEPKVADAWGSVLLVVAGSFVWAVSQGMVRRIENIAPLTLLAWVSIFAAPQLFVMSLIFEGNQIAAIQTAGPVAWMAILYLGLVMTAFGYSCWYSLLRRRSMGQVAPFLLLIPVVSIVGATLALGESLGLMAVLGGAIILAGVAFIVLEKSDASPSG